VGVAGEPSAHRFLAEQADLIVAVGTGLNVMTAQPIQKALQPERLAVVNIDMGEVSRIVRPSLFVEADAGAVFAQLNQLADKAAVLPRAPAPVPVIRFTPALAPDLPPDGCHSVPATGALLQSQALERLQPLLPAQGHVLFDAGNCAAAALHYLRIPANVSATIALGMGGHGLRDRRGHRRTDGLPARLADHGLLRRRRLPDAGRRGAYRRRSSAAYPVRRFQ